MLWKKWLALLAFASVHCTEAQPLPIAIAGRSDYRIVVASDATAAERTAAAELSRYLAAVTRAEFPQVETPGSDGKNLWVGATAAAAERFHFDPAQLRQDEILLYSNEAGELLLAGARPAGSLYAVYTFLEDYCGIRFWTSSDTAIPSRPDLTVPALAIRYAPPILIRETFTDDFNHHPEFSVRRRNNGHHPAIAPEWGGHQEIIGFVHTFDRLLPASEYLESHPEYFSLRDGRRVGGQLTGQLCLSSPEVLRQITAAVLARLRNHPNPKIISVSQNDNHNSCQCDACLTSDAHYGSPAGTLLVFVNAVAAAVAKEFPGVLVETLAYQYTRTAPTGIRPHANVIVRLCSIECDFSHPLSAPENAAFGDDLRAWSQLTDQLAIWDYTGNYSNHLAVYPNFSTYAENIRFFAANHVRSVFSQNIYKVGDRLGDWMPLRGWLISQLLWNPEQSQRELENEFLSGYYGDEAAPLLRRYLDLLETEIRNRKIPLCPLTHARADQYLSIETIFAARHLLEQAVAAATTPEQRERLLLVQAGIDTAIIEAAPLLRWLDRKEELATIPETATQLAKLLETNGINEAREGTAFAFFAPAWKNLQRTLNAPRPARFATLPVQDYFEVQDAFFSLSQSSDAIRQDDPAASDGQSIVLPSPTPSWALQYEIPAQLRTHAPRWQLYAALKCDDAAAGIAATAGVYHRSQRRGDYRAIPAGDIAGSEYRYIDLGIIELQESSYFFVSASEQDVGNLAIDRLIFVRQD